ncbi:uncharacterized protein LOC119720485 [Patiria miniata]|uniref:Uncharacterized protein n=1 Tax=Patiria miniata TaxID=46514 RepID=A0A913Z5N5_PATMI|nr:uncharacterized protein LOC119720485 [Patiria miniata]XP_038046094.1 uncharacterized protein LOC119720485 [Patiria miniata]XP_038046095.1 uncharacterized protein LOC119720485 [Patiria miniata]XP_038046096.1 uncharacterized protein LOC119720485 [Patiria miniata]
MAAVSLRTTFIFFLLVFVVLLRTTSGQQPSEGDSKPLAFSSTRKTESNVVTTKPANSPSTTRASTSPSATTDELITTATQSTTRARTTEALTQEIQVTQTTSDPPRNTNSSTDPETQTTATRPTLGPPRTTRTSTSTGNPSTKDASTIEGSTVRENPTTTNTLPTTESQLTAKRNSTTTATAASPDTSTSASMSAVTEGQTTSGAATTEVSSTAQVNPSTTTAQATTVQPTATSEVITTNTQITINTQATSGTSTSESPSTKKNPTTSATPESPGKSTASSALPTRQTATSANTRTTPSTQPASAFIYYILGASVLVSVVVLGCGVHCISLRIKGQRRNNHQDEPSMEMGIISERDEDDGDPCSSAELGAVALQDLDGAVQLRNESDEETNNETNPENVELGGASSRAEATEGTTNIDGAVQMRNESREETQNETNPEHAVLERTESRVGDLKLRIIAQHLGSEWERLATVLGFSSGEIFTFKNDNDRRTDNQIFAMLVAWRRRQSSSDDACRILLRALEEIGRVDLSREVQGIISDDIANSLKTVQKEVTYFTKLTASSIPLHPLVQSRKVGMKEFFIQPELMSVDARKGMPGRPLNMSGGEIRLDALETMKPITLEEFIRLMGNGEVRNNRILLSGGAGCGKTTLLKKVANDLTFNSALPLANFKIVVPLRLNQMVETGCLIDAMLKQILPRNTTVTPLRLKEVIDKYEEHIAFLLDGLDEIPLKVLQSSKGLLSIKDVLENRVLVRSCVLVTTRPHMVDHVLSAYPHYDVVQTRGFSQQNCNEFIVNFFKDDVEKREALIAQLTTSPSLRSIAQIPIISLILCIIQENPGSVSDRLSDLYSQVARVLVRNPSTKDQRDHGVQLISILNGLGKVALNGLFRPNGGTLIFTRDEFNECGQVYEDALRFGFLIEERCTSGLEVRRVVIFVHKSVQEYCAAHVMVNLLDVDEDGFKGYLKDVVAENVFGLEYLFRFCCGRSPKAARLIVEHVQKIRGDKVRLCRLVRLLLLESGSKELASKLHPQTDVECETSEDLKAFAYCLEYVRSPVSINQMRIVVSSCDDLQLLGKCLQSGNMKSIKQIVCKYSISEGWRGHLTQLEQTLAVDKVDRLVLALWIPDHIPCDVVFLSGCINRVSKMCGEFGLNLKGSNFGRSLYDIKCLVGALKGCSLFYLVLSNINMHGKVRWLSNLFTLALKQLLLRNCNLGDDDIKDLICVMPNSLLQLDLTENVLSPEAMKDLTLHLRRLPKLKCLKLANTGSNADLISKIVSRNLCHMLETDVCTFVKDV